MSLDREYLRRTAARWVDNENLFDAIGEPWAPGVRDAARLASDYLAVLAELEHAKTLIDFFTDRRWDYDSALIRYQEWQDDPDNHEPEPQPLPSIPSKPRPSSTG